MASFDPNESAVIQKALEFFGGWIQRNVLNLVQDAQKTADCRDLDSHLGKLTREASSGGPVGGPDKVRISDSFLPLLKRVLIVYRREEAVRIQHFQDKTHHLEVLGALDAELETIDRFTKQEWFLDTTPRQIPTLSDFLPIQRIEEIHADSGTTARKFDEKFHILQSPELFLKDLEFYRRRTDLRGSSLAVAFLDIDHFKGFNTDYTETKVDRNVLPRFMQLVEAHLHFHGHAYRQGGDEYLVLLPGFSRNIAIEFLDEVREKVASLTYSQIERKATVSIGVCIAGPDCYLTNREIQEKANKAKERAKREGRNRIATYKGDSYRDEDLEIVRPK